MEAPSPDKIGADPRMRALAGLVAIIDRLRAPDGCPWDREQTLASMAPHLIEEAYEVLEAIETGAAGDAAPERGDVVPESGHIAEELGDVLMNVVLMSRIAEQSGDFDLARAAELVSDKLVRRHPHVFGEVEAHSAETVVQNWEAIKKAERSEKEADASALAGIPRTLPALQRAQRVCGKAIAAGFRWSNAAGAIGKLEEEHGELRDALTGVDVADPRSMSSAQRKEVEHELGDVLLAAAFAGAYLEIDPERACREALRRFESRFRTMEAELSRPMREHSLDELVRAWKRAKEALA